jgi:rubrerythrin
MNAMEFMTRFEEDALHLYEVLSCGSNDTERRTIFNLLADAQRRHLSSLLDHKDRLECEMCESAIVERAGTLVNGFRMLLERSDLLSGLKTDPDAFSHVVKAEEECINLLGGMAKAEPLANMRAILNWLCTEERHHLERIESIYEFMEAPRTYLEWEEFSNLRPL